MFYIVTNQTPKHNHHQYTWEDLFNDTIDFSKEENQYRFDKTGTITRTVEYINYSKEIHQALMNFDNRMDEFLNKYADLYKEERSSLYNTFYIPKHSGGLRKIDAPNDKLMTALREVKNMLEVDLGMKYHTAAFAYVKGRSTIDAVKKHQSNESRWFLKTDFSNFFGSTTKDFVMKMLGMISPTCYIMRSTSMKTKLEQIIDLCFLNGGLPQGTPVSPTLTNIMMIPIDHKLANDLWKDGFVYTRYADDIIISHRYDFKYNMTVKMINETLKMFNAPFQIKDAKTRYGSSSGRNFNLGVMLNKDNEITIGYQKKKQFKAMCCNFIMDLKNGKSWDIEDLQQFQGIMSYYLMVEKDNINEIIRKINEKFSVDLNKMLKEQIGRI